ncbi:hypothetical protein DFH08DRAFT_965352 [Mycena albidolilacea]|uniref:Uncharacterized protein n=1 Tax=Mycena albidolilacea TaxID=1033008 RepID=A0AAD6ZQJ3_9AGAR|nr:hypothetical protein DFH08DRAFT_965352 [Mycena albidolilacea]
MHAPHVPRRKQLWVAAAPVPAPPPPALAVPAPELPVKLTPFTGTAAGPSASVVMPLFLTAH